MGTARQDLAIANANDNTLTILLGNGDGTFTPASATPATGVAPRAIAVGDFNADGKQDLAIANANDNTLTIASGQRRRYFHACFGHSCDGCVLLARLRVGDFNGDGKQDLAIANANDNTLNDPSGQRRRHFCGRFLHPRYRSKSLFTGCRRL